MTASEEAASAGTGGSEARSVAPTSRAGWLAVAVSALGAVAWAVLPVIAGLAGDRDPGLSSGAMVAGMALIVVAAVVNVLVLTVGRQRSLLNVIAGVLTLPAVGLLAMLALGGFFNDVF